VQAALGFVPELRAVLPPTAIGNDFPYNGRWIGITSSGTGVYVSLAGYVGVTVGWVEGFELNFFGAVLGFDIRRPALKPPGLGRFGSRPACDLKESPNVHAPPANMQRGRRQASGCARLLEGTATRRPQAFDRHVPFGRAFE
jgi:hypothetical protein